jgi:hypothetical protein
MWYYRLTEPMRYDLVDLGRDVPLRARPLSAV